MTARKRKKMNVSRKLLYIFSYLFIAAWLIPIVWMFITSITPRGESVTIISELFTPPFTWANYEYVLENAMIWRWTFNSFFVASITTVLTLLLTSLAAFALSRLRFVGRNLIFWLIIAGLMVPIEAMIVPLFQIMIELNIVNTYSALILPNLAMPLGVFLLKQFYDGVPNELMEAAKMDGAGLLKIYWKIFLPLSRSSMAALGIFTFIMSWNDFLWPFLAVNSESMFTLPVAIPTFQSSFSSELMIPMAVNTLASVPAIIVFILFQKHIIQGIAMTGIK
ncbi:sugar ABC transporter permease [Halobacillus andaensis]|uniref:Sugar ABC transporter permease n=1 Tax=Halobacillus andaensis TaxID=1176239 RepID=A0A917EYF8_HALAA|nr:carbohydrate ABC transporter permease [Halobacillus andaensis]MBP2004323.1 multiple sugar transport system permease protein [Halobacillus andaensis]GGF22516.1 sugar ABC transporter permease [Halobacillus andaensis]